jgi:hypothetical protein
MNEVYDMDKTECKKGSLVKVSGHNKKLQIVIQTDSGQGTQLGIMGREAETAPISRHLYASLLRFYHSFIHIYTHSVLVQPAMQTTPVSHRFLMDEKPMPPFPDRRDPAPP